MHKLIEEALRISARKIKEREAANIGLAEQENAVAAQFTILEGMLGAPKYGISVNYDEYLARYTVVANYYMTDTDSLELDFDQWELAYTCLNYQCNGTSTQYKLKLSESVRLEFMLYAELDESEIDLLKACGKIVTEVEEIKASTSERTYSMC